MTKLLSGFVLPSHTSSMQPAVHISHTRTWAFCLKWLADLKTQREQERNEHRCKRPPPHTPILTSDAGINLIHRWRAGGAAKMFLNSSVRGLKYSNTHTLVLTWLWRSPACQWTGRGVCPGSASRSSAEHGRGEETTCQSRWGRTGPMGSSLDTQEPGSSL